MKELREKIAAVLYYFGAAVHHIEEGDMEDLPPDVKDAIKHYYGCKDSILEEITKDNA